MGWMAQAERIAVYAKMCSERHEKWKLHCTPLFFAANSIVNEVILLSAFLSFLSSFTYPYIIKNKSLRLFFLFLLHPSFSSLLVSGTFLQISQTPSGVSTRAKLKRSQDLISIHDADYGSSQQAKVGIKALFIWIGFGDKNLHTYEGVGHNY